MRMTGPTLKEVLDPGNCHCRKGFYAPNVQATCDKHKRFLWAHPMNKESTHDSMAFARTRLIELLKEQATKLKEQGLFLVGDSAHPLCSFLQTPHDQQDMQDDCDRVKDAHNCCLSANRIWIECSFGEFIMRWGMFWRTLRFGLVKNGNVISAAMLLHNFIVEWRMTDKEQSGSEKQHFRQFTIDMDAPSQRQMTDLTGELPHALVTDNNEPKPAGRPSMSEKRLMEEGEVLRNTLMLALAKDNLKRPKESGMKHNN